MRIIQDLLHSSCVLLAGPAELSQAQHGTSRRAPGAALGAAGAVGLAAAAVSTRAGRRGTLGSLCGCRWFMSIVGSCPDKHTNGSKDFELPS